MIKILEGTQFEKVSTIILNSELLVRQSSVRSVDNKIKPDEDNKKI
jgi:hypothetical protein